MKKLGIVFIFLVVTGCMIYYENGQMNLAGTFKNPELVEKDGLTYFHGKPFTGVAIYEYPNGKVKEEFKFENGVKVGVWEWYSQEGRLLRKATYENGRLVKEQNFGA
jgi:antitoxin component YwqK of YwqJK toxin-antitoxin module